MDPDILFGKKKSVFKLGVFITKMAKKTFIENNLLGY